MAHLEEESKVPVLITPREEAVVDGRHVSFIWKPVRGATGYTLQISDGPSFEEILVESDVLQVTEYRLEQGLPLDERTYYWRVLATHAGGHVHGGDNIESFISGTIDDERLHLAAPDQEEDLGPVERLVRGAVAEAAVEATHAPRYVEEESELGVEHEGIEAGEILGFALATAVALGLAIFVLFQYVDITADAARYASVGTSGYPELREVELEATRRLTQYGVVDPQQGIYQIPIDRAIDVMANEARQRPGVEYSPELNLLPESR